MNSMHYVRLNVHKKTIRRQGRERSGPPGKQNRSNTTRTEPLDGNSSSTTDRGHGSNHFHRLKLPRLSSNCFRTGSLTATRARDSEWMSGSAKAQVADLSLGSLGRLIDMHHWTLLRDALHRDKETPVSRATSVLR